jgi:cytochrome c oxidase subunit 2
MSLVLSACSFIEIDSPLTIFEPAGPFSERIDGLFWPVFWIAAGVFVLVQGGILVAVLLFRDRSGRKEPKQIHGNAKLEVTWTVIPALILAVIAVPTVRAVFDLTECGPDALTVDVIGHQWWFEFEYPDTGIQTANVMVVPAGREVCARMTSDDVIHSFWIPALNGKRDVIPGQETIVRLQADDPGEYWGHCAEFCGLSHSLMRMRVQALPEADFQRWLTDQQLPATPPAEDSQAFAGLQVYENKGCTQCHTVDYGADSQYTNIVDPTAFNGPNLTHFASRNVFAGAYLPYEGLDYEDALAEWLANPPEVKPGSFMPNLGLTAQEIDDLIAWLETLR